MNLLGRTAGGTRSFLGLDHSLALVGVLELGEERCVVVLQEHGELVGVDLVSDTVSTQRSLQSLDLVEACRINLYLPSLAHLIILRLQACSGVLRSRLTVAPRDEVVVLLAAHDAEVSRELRLAFHRHELAALDVAELTSEVVGVTQHRRDAFHQDARRVLHAATLQVSMVRAGVAQLGVYAEHLAHQHRCAGDEVATGLQLEYERASMRLGVNAGSNFSIKT